MAVAVAISPNPAKALNPCTVNVSGLAATTKYTLSLYRVGGGASFSVAVTSDGAGNASTSFVPPLPGGVTFQCDVIQTTTATAGTTAFQVGGTG